MSHLKTLVQQTLPKALIPFLTAYSFSSSGETSSFRLISQWFKNPIKDVTSPLQGLGLQNYAQFMIITLIFSVIVNVLVMVINSLTGRSNGSKNDQKSSDVLLFSEEDSLTARSSKRIAAAVLHYTIAYCFYQFVIGVCLGSLLAGSFLTQPKMMVSQDTQLNFREIDSGVSTPSFFRMLEQTSTTPVSQPKLTDKQLSALSLSMGKVVGSLNFDAYCIVLSGDGKTAYASVQRQGKVNIIDVSNPQAPNIIGVINLSSSRTYYNRFLKLDGDYLFASNFQTLEIIDVSNPEAPRIISKVEDPNAEECRFSDVLPNVYQMSMAFSAKTLFVGGLGLQVFDISDLAHPQLISSTKIEESYTDEPTFEVGSVSLSFDGKSLFYAHGELEILDVSDPKDLKILGSYSSPRGPIRSMLLIKDTKTAYVTVSEVEDTLVLEKIDVSDFANLKRIASFEEPIQTSYSANVVFVSATPNFSHAFVCVATGDFDNIVVGFSLMTDEFLDTHKSLIKTADSLVFSKDERILYSASDSLFQIIELTFDYPNSRTFSLSDNSIYNIQSSSPLAFALSADSKILFVSNGEQYTSAKDNSLDIYDVRNPSLPVLISTTPLLGKAGIAVLVSRDNKRVVMSSYSDIQVWDTSDLSAPEIWGRYTGDSAGGVEEFTMSSDGKYVFVYYRDGPNQVSLKILDFSTQNVHEIDPPILQDKDLGAKLALSSDDKTLYTLLSDKIEVYDISDIKSPKELATMAYSAKGGEEIMPYSARTDPDNKFLFVVVMEGSLVKLLTYDISVPSNPAFKGEFTRPQLSYESSSAPALSSDLSKAYLIQSTGLLVLNITNPAKTKIAHTVPFSFDVSHETVADFKISSNNKVAYLLSKNAKLIRIISLENPYTVFLNQESFFLGQKYSGTVTLFELHNGKRYVPLDQGDHRFVKSAILDIKVPATEHSTKQTLSPLPYWMTFDKENYMITIEAKKQRDLGVYTLYNAFSNKIPQTVFDNLEIVKNGSIYSEDLLTTLMSMGYIDNELFVTSTFGPIQTFFLPTHLSGSKAEIYAILKKYFVETCTTFDILPSLHLRTGESGKNQPKLSIDSPSYNQYKVEIVLDKAPNVSFVSRHYSSLVPRIVEQKSQLILEGSQSEVNYALSKLVVNIEDQGSCAGNITVNDNLNPTISQSFADIVHYLEVNGAPYANPNVSSLQDQIDTQQIYTGTYFTFRLNPLTFADNNTEQFTYEIRMKDPKRKIPDWLSFHNLEFKGTPLDELSGREISLVLKVSNEFKSTEFDLDISVRISSGLILKILMKYAPYVLSFLTILVSFNRMYNIFRKNKYRHNVDFYIKAGEQINPRTMFPVLFTGEEAREVKILLRYLKRKVASEVNSTTISDIHLALNFVDKTTQVFDKVKVIEMINTITAELSSFELKGLRLSLRRSGLRRDLINQLVINQLVRWQLASDQEKKTSRLFEKIKKQWSEMVEWGLSSRFIINQVGLEEVLEAQGLKADGISSRTASLIEESSPTLQNSRKTFQQHLLEAEAEKMFNDDLLKNAIIAEAYEHQTLEMSAIRAQIHVKEQVGENPLKAFTKFDLEAMNINSAVHVDYGINVAFENDMLHISGVPQENFRGRTMVVQITDVRLRILKEIWVYEASLKPGRAVGMEQSAAFVNANERSLRGSNYEIY